MFLVHPQCKIAEDFLGNGLAIVSFSGEKYEIVDRQKRYSTAIIGGFKSKPHYLYGRTYIIYEGGIAKIIEV